MMVECVHDKILQEDLAIISADQNINFGLLAGKTILITGATGLIGASLIRALLCAAREHSLNIKLLAAVRNREKAAAIFGELVNRQELGFVVCDVTRPLEVEEPIDYMIHCAGVTTSKAMVTMPVETLLTSVVGTRNLLDLAKQKAVKSFVYVSSMEMYGAFYGLDREVKESDLGYIDPLKVRSNYPESKRLCENMCIAYLAEYGVPAKIARLAQTFGAGILPGENRVFAQFARSVINGENIVLHTAGLSEGNYCYTRDTVRALLTILLKGENGEAYNVANPASHTTIAGMAEMLCNKIAGGKIDLVFDIPKTNIYGYAADTKMKLNSDKLQALGWKPEVGLEEAYRRLILSMEANKLL